MNVSQSFHSDATDYAERKGRRRKIKCTWTSDAAYICRDCSENDRQCVSQGIVSNATTGKRSNLKIRVGKLESIIERLSTTHPEKALKVMSETESNSTPSNWSNSTVQNGLTPESVKPKELKSPLFDLFDNNVVGLTLAPVHRNCLIV